MKGLKLKYILLHIGLPLLLGCALYFFSAFIQFNSLIRNYLPDGLWSYAFFSCLFLLWERQINLFWTLAGILLFILFEVLQYTGAVLGTFDVWDMVVYAAFSGLAMLTNQYHKFTNSKFQTE